MIKFLKKPSTLIIILAMLFGIPLFSAFFMAKEKEPLSSHTTNHGTLITPPLDLATLDIKNTQGQPIPIDAWKGKWLLLYVNVAEVCDAQCDENLYNIRQIRQATGKNSSRVERAILTFENAIYDQHLQNVLDIDFAGTQHFVVSKNDFFAFTHSNAPAKLSLIHNSIFLVDPLGNVMMIYHQNIAPMDIFKDLNRLLKLSRIG